MSRAQDAIQALEQLGLTEYEARCFVALMKLPHGTAKEIGQVADIPRSRVYETMDRLRDKGLVELHQAEPREYQSVSVDTALEILRTEYESYFDTVDETLQHLEPNYKKAEQAVWALNTHEQVTGRMVDILDEADDEVLLVLLEDGMLDDVLLDGLVAAGDRGLTLHVGTTTDVVHERLRDAGIDATVFTTGLIEWFSETSDSPRLGRLLMVDRGPVLVSALHEEELPGVPNETAVWTDGTDHGFATFAERVLTYELKEHVPAVPDETPAE